MKFLLFRRLALFVQVTVFISVFQIDALTQQSSSSTLQKGVVVARLTSKSDAEKVGIRPGDILLHWTRGDASGEINSPFDLPYLRYEQASRGRLRIDGVRRGHHKIWYLGSDVWGIWPRPNFSGLILHKYKVCESLPKTTDSGVAILCWQNVETEARGLQTEWLVPSLLSEAAQRFAINGQWDASDATFQAALDQTKADDHIVRGFLLIQRARILSGQDDVVRASQYFEQAVQEWERAGNTAVAIATPLLELGLTALNAGDYSKAEHSWQRALTILESLAPTSLEATLAYGNLAVLYQQKGDLVKAEEYYRRAVVKERQYLPKSQYLPQQLTNLGTLARARGDLRTAEAYHREALIALKIIGIENPGGANIFDNLSDCALDREDLAKAEWYQKRSLAIRERLLPRGLDVAASLSSLGLIAERKGELSEAKRYYQQALTIEERLAPASPAIADVIGGLGRVALRQGDTARAEPLFRQALDILDRVAPLSLRHVESLASLAGTLRRSGRIDEAAQIYRQVLGELENKVTQLTIFGETQSRYRARHAAYYREYTDLLLQQGNRQLAFETMESSHARTLFDMLSSSHIDIRHGVDPVLLAEERGLRESIAAKSQYRIQLLARKHAVEELNRSDRETTSLLDRYQQLGAQITNSSPGYEALTHPRPLTLQEIQKLLDTDSVLLEYSLGEERSFVWVVGTDSLAAFDLPKRSEIEKAARRVYNLLTVRNRTLSSANEEELEVFWRKAEAEYPKAARELSRMVLGPATAMIAGKRLVVVSDGALQYIPFAALPSPDDLQFRKPLVVDHEIVNLPSASVLAELRRQASTRASPPKTVAVIADPVFDAQDRRVNNDNAIASVIAPRGIQSTDSLFKRLTRSAADVSNRKTTSPGEFRFERLLYTRKEADAILSVTPPGTAMKALDFQANRATALSPVLAQYRVVHFATHGLLDSKHPELSGLVLSLVNKQGKPQDGFLELQDIYNMNLPVDLVVLSGCKTGLGEEINGEGLIGLTRGFMYAGASRVMASSWGVNDWATSELMERFYRAMEQQHMRPAAALRTAQIQMWKQNTWKSPYYWAAFQIQGEWR